MAAPKSPTKASLPSALALLSWPLTAHERCQRGLSRAVQPNPHIEQFARGRFVGFTLPFFIAFICPL